MKRNSAPPDMQLLFGPNSIRRLTRFINTSVQYSEVGYLKIDDGICVEMTSLDAMNTVCAVFRISDNINFWNTADVSNMVFPVNLHVVWKVIHPIRNSLKSITIYDQEGELVMNAGGKNILMNVDHYECKLPQTIVYPKNAIEDNRMFVFSVKPKTLKQIILNLSLGDGFFQIEIKDQNVQFSAKNGLGLIQYQMKNVNVVRRPHGKTQSKCTYMVKGAKHMCHFFNDIECTFMGFAANLPLVIQSRMRRANLAISTSPVVL